MLQYKEKDLFGRMSGDLKILAVGDVTSPSAVDYLKKNLWKFREEKKIDFCVVNGENAGFITGIYPDAAEVLLRAGADCISGGNHTLRNHRSHTFLEETAEILRPINFGEAVPGHGYAILDANGYRILVICAMGRVHIEPMLDSAFTYIDKVLQRESGNYDFSMLDIHAEATGEKLAYGYCYDGKINMIFGTHTHVQTADEQILPKGTGYITDVGMCGESGGVLGMDAEVVVKRMRTSMTYDFKLASGKCVANGVIFTLNTQNGAVEAIERVKF